MKTTRWILLGLLALGLAGSASAAAKASLTATNNTIGGPGTTSIAAGGSERIFFHGGGTSDVCVTVVNTGKLAVTVNFTSTGSPTGNVPAGSSAAICGEDASQIDLVCNQEQACSAQWRVDDN